MPAEGEAYELGKGLVRAIKNKETYPDQEKRHAEMFERMRALVLANRIAGSTDTITGWHRAGYRSRGPPSITGRHLYFLALSPAGQSRWYGRGAARE